MCYADCIFGCSIQGQRMLTVMIVVSGGMAPFVSYADCCGLLHDSGSVCVNCNDWLQAARSVCV